MKSRLFTCLVVLMLTGGLATAQRASNLNEFQASLLSLEAETPPFRHFEGLTILDILSRRSRGAPLPQDELVAAKEDARALRASAEEWMDEADSLSNGLYLAPGVELDAAMMYRYSAWELGRYFEIWSAVLTRLMDAETTSPASFWRFDDELDRANDAYETARVYRLLANQQYMIEVAQDTRSLD